MDKWKKRDHDRPVDRTARALARNGFLISQLRVPGKQESAARCQASIACDPKRSAPNANLLLTLWRHAWDGTQNRRKLRVFCLKGRFYGCVRSEPREHSRARFW